MALFERKSKSNREPDDAGRITASVGAAIWKVESGDHDVRVGEAYPNKNGKKASIRTTVSLSLFDELVESIGELAVAFAEDQSVPERLRDMLGHLGRSVLVAVASFREEDPGAGNPVTLLSKVAGDLNGTSSHM